MKLPSILICDDDQLFHLAVKTALKKSYEIRSAYHGDEALAILRNQRFEVVLLDIQMRTPSEGLELIPKLKELAPEMAIIMSSGLVDFGSVREALRKGATDYVPKGFDPEELRITLERVLGRKQLEERNAQQSSEVQRYQGRYPLIGQSPPILKLREDLAKIRNSSASVLIQGETGTGKEVVARNLRTPLDDGSLCPFVAIDGGTLVSTLAESQLFGFEKGAFTGAERTTRGLFEEAHGGIAFIDELGEIPIALQAKLLRVLQEREVLRLGATRAIPLEFRVVAATHRDIPALIRSGQFREDLYQRLNVLPLHLPPLRERKSDIPLLVEHFLKRGDWAQSKQFSEEAIEVLGLYSWPGNIRELGNVVDYLMTLVEGPKIEVADLPGHIRDSGAENKHRSDGGFYDHVARFEAEFLRTAYVRHQGNISRLAQELEMDRSHLYTKLKAYQIHRPTSGGGVQS